MSPPARRRKMSARTVLPKGRKESQTARPRSPRTTDATRAITSGVTTRTVVRAPTDRLQTTGQGAASTRGNVSVNITPDQRTRIHEIIIKEHSAPRLDHVDFSLSAGTVVPRSVRLIAVPRVILEIEPEWRGFEYFLVGDEIIIVNPRSMEIVAVLDV